MGAENPGKFEPFFINTLWELDCSPGELRSVLAEPLAITRWWAPVFLHAECIDEGGKDRGGYVMRCFTKGFLPHSFQFVARIAAVSADVLVIETRGDFHGVGSVTLSHAGTKTHAVVEWSVHVSQPYIRPLLKLLKPVFVWNHRWAMRQGRKGLEQMMRAARDNAETFVPIRPTFPHNLERFRRPLKWRI